MNRRASAYVFVYGLAFLAGGALLFIVLTQVINEHVYPLTNDTTTFNMTAADMAEIDRKIDFWGYIPVVLIFLVVMYWVYHTANRTDGEG